MLQDDVGLQLCVLLAPKFGLTCLLVGVKLPILSHARQQCVEMLILWWAVEMPLFWAAALACTALAMGS